MLEVINGITFLTPLWLPKPRVALVHHIHRDHYVTEFGRRGAVAALLRRDDAAEAALRRRAVSDHQESAKRDLVALGVPEEDVTSATSASSRSRRRSPERGRDAAAALPGRLKRYKRIELLLDVLEAIPGAVLDIAGEGDHRPALEAEIAARGSATGSSLHGHVAEERKAELSRGRG